MWKRLAPGTWGLDDGDYIALVKNVIEHWVVQVQFFGEIIHKGEWDGRYAAMNNAVDAIKYARWLRDPNQANCEAS